MIVKILKFGASWCYPCKVLSDKLKGFDKVPVEDVDCQNSENQDLVKQYKIKNLPTLVFVNAEGRPMARLSGVVTIDSINGILKEYSYESK